MALRRRLDKASARITMPVMTIMQVAVLYCLTERRSSRLISSFFDVSLTTSMA